MFIGNLSFHIANYKRKNFSDVLKELNDRISKYCKKTPDILLYFIRFRVKENYLIFQYEQIKKGVKDDQL